MTHFSNFSPYSQALLLKRTFVFQVETIFKMLIPTFLSSFIWLKDHIGLIPIDSEAALFMSSNDFTSRSESFNSLVSNLLDGLSLWISCELRTLALAWTKYCLNNADPEQVHGHISEYNLCIINLWSPLGSQIPLDHWSQKAAFQLKANSILWLSWEGKEKWWYFHAAFQKETCGGGGNQLAKGNKQYLVFTECLSEISENPLPIKICSLFQRVKNKRKGGQHEIIQDPRLGTPLVR